MITGNSKFRSIMFSKTIIHIRHHRNGLNLLTFAVMKNNHIIFYLINYPQVLLLKKLCPPLSLHLLLLQKENPRYTILNYLLLHAIINTENSALIRCTCMMYNTI